MTAKERARKPHLISSEVAAGAARTAEEEGLRRFCSRG